MQRRKPMDMAFEDDVWALFARMGFSFLNKDRNFRLPYSNDEKLTQQIDIFVADEETILIIDCHMHSISAHYISVHQKFINKQQPC